MKHFTKHWLKYLFICDILLVYLIFQRPINIFYRQHVEQFFQVPTYAAGNPEHNHSLEPTELKRNVIMQVPLIQQLPELPRGCEVTTLAMLLQSAGVKVNKMTLAKQINKVPYRTKNGYQGNPNIGFVGNMYDTSKKGYGVYHKPLANLAHHYLNDRVLDLTGSSFQRIADQVKKGKPVAVTVSYQYKPLSKRQFVTWHTKQGPVKISHNEHMVLITGVDSHHVYVNDPYADKPNTKVARTPFVESWRQFGKQAISYK